MKKPLAADNLIKYKKKTYSEEQHLVSSRYEQFYGDISTLFQSYCQTRINYLQACYHAIAIQRNRSKRRNSNVTLQYGQTMMPKKGLRVSLYIV